MALCRHSGCKVCTYKILTKTVAAEVLTAFLALILTLNDFNLKFYLQLQGPAMGTNCIPSYVNIFMEYFVYMNIF